MGKLSSGLLKSFSIFRGSEEEDGSVRPSLSGSSLWEAFANLGDQQNKVTNLGSHHGSEDHL